MDLQSLLALDTKLPGGRCLTHIGREGTEVAAHELDDAEQRLRAYFLKRRDELSPRPREATTAALSRITRIATDAPSATNAAWWSAYAIERELLNPAAFRPPRRQRKSLPTSMLSRPWNPPELRKVSRPWGRSGRRRHVGPEPPTKVEHKCLWIDTSSRPARLKRYDKHSRSWRVDMEIHDSIAGDKITAEKWLTDWARPVASEIILHVAWPQIGRLLPVHVTTMLRGGRPVKSGRPAYLACATLAALLDVSPTKVADLLANYRRRRPKP
jgi:hypothetical protein